MKLILAMCVGCFALSACQTVSADLTSAVNAVNADVAAAQATLPKIASTVSGACAKIMPAEGYFNAAVLTGLIPSAAVSAENSAAGVINNICNASSATSLSAVVSDLGTAWAVVQAATKKTGT